MYEADDDKVSIRVLKTMLHDANEEILSLRIQLEEVSSTVGGQVDMRIMADRKLESLTGIKHYGGTPIGPGAI